MSKKQNASASASVSADMSGQSCCPCGRLTALKKPLPFANCCASYLDDFANTPAPDAETLMRSRYSAFVLSHFDYLTASWHASTRPSDLSHQGHYTWLGLQVRRHTVIDTDHAEVEFVARYRVAGRGARIHEVSRFVREAGRWYYLDSDLL